MDHSTRKSNRCHPVYFAVVLLAAVLAFIFASSGQVGKSLGNGDIPLGTRCSDPVFGDGVTATRTIVENAIGQTIGTAFNDDQVIAAAEKRFGKTLPKLEYIQLCSDLDETRIATINGVNLGRR